MEEKNKKKLIITAAAGIVLLVAFLAGMIFLLKGCQKSTDKTLEYASSGSFEDSQPFIADINGSEAGSYFKESNLADEESSSDKKTDDDINVVFSAGNSWQSEGKNFTIYEAVINNKGDKKINSWKLIIEVKNGLEISQYWNCNVNRITYHGNESFEITPADYNKTIDGNNQLTGIGLIVSYNGTYTMDTCIVEADGILSVSGENQLTDNSSQTFAPSGAGGDLADNTNSNNTGDFGTAEADKKSDNLGNAGSDNTGSNNADSSGGSGGSPASPVYGGLHVSGTKLLDSKGNQVQLKGVSTHGLAWFPDYVNNEAFKTLRDDWGANVIRLAMYSAEYGGYCSGGDKNNLKNLIHKGVCAATELNMYVIIDWHILSDGNPNTNKAEAIKFFDEMSAKYASYNNVIYEICNEPNGADWNSQIKPYAEEVIGTIRKNDSDALILVGTNTWSQDVDAVIGNELSDENVMYTLHFYAATHKDNIRNKLTKALSAGIPVFVSECSICDASGNGGIDYSSANTWLKLLNDNNISFIGWSLCNKAETSALIKSSCNKYSGWGLDDLTEAGKWFRTAIKGN